MIKTSRAMDILRSTEAVLRTIMLIMSVLTVMAITVPTIIATALIRDHTTEYQEPTPSNHPLQNRIHYEVSH
jgi:hypothetical protein